jgi:hypothetical protein
MWYVGRVLKAVKSENPSRGGRMAGIVASNASVKPKLPNRNQD